MSSKSFKVVIFSAMVLVVAIVGMKFYEKAPRDEDVVKNFVFKNVEDEQEKINKDIDDIKNEIHKGEKLEAQSIDNEENENKKEVSDKIYKGEKLEAQSIDNEENENKKEVSDKIYKGEKLEAQSVMDKEEPVGLFSALSSDTITIKQGDNYLTNKSVLVEIKGTGSSNITVGGQSVLTTGSGSYSHVCEIADNLQIEAGSAKKTVKNIVTVLTGVDGGETNKKYVKNKTNTTATLGGKIVGADGVTLSSSNIKELGVRYWRSDMEDEIYTVRTSSIGSETKTLKYEVVASGLKENTTYYMQAYMVNNVGEVLLGDVKEFSTRGQGEGLYGLYYNGNTLKKIKQERVATMNFSNSIFTNGINKVKWIGEIAPVNNGVIKLRVTGVNGNIKISNGASEDNFSGSNWSNKELTTTNVYEVGKKYPIVIEFGASSSIKVEWKEDGEYQEIPREQLYPKEYVKILSAVINSKGTDNQKIDKNTGKLIGKKVITNGRNMSAITIGYSSDNASTVTIDKEYNIGTSGNNTCKIEGSIIYNTNGVVESITKNVSNIDYSTKKVTLRNGSVWNLYSDVDIVGRVIVTKDNSKEIYKVYDLGRYIDGGNLSDGKSKNDVYRVDNQDNTYILDLYNKLGESKEYQAMLEQYSTMERLVEDSKPVTDKWNIGIGDARLFSQVPIRVLLSFDGDSSFEMKDPVIKISKTLYRSKSAGSNMNSNILFKKEEVISDPDNKFILALPTDKDAQGKISKDIYANWRYMSVDSGEYYVESSNRNTATMREDDDYIYITLDGYSAANELKYSVSNNVVMLNFVMRVNSIEKKTSKEIFDDSSVKDKLIDNAYVTYTKAEVSSINNTDVEVVNVPIKIKIKPQVVFE